MRRLAAAGDEVGFTGHRRAEGAAAVAARSWACDLSVPGAAGELFDRMEAGGSLPDDLVHCARAGGGGELERGEDLAAERCFRVHAGAAIAAVREMVRRRWDVSIGGEGIRNVVLLSALAPGERFGVAAQLAAAHAALSGVAMALGHELGPSGFRVNVVALGLLDGGASSRIPGDQVAAYTRFAALRRIGTAEEAAATACWLVRTNRVLNGKVIAANGGI